MGRANTVAVSALPEFLRSPLVGALVAGQLDDRAEEQVAHARDNGGMNRTGQAEVELIRSAAHEIRAFHAGQEGS